MQTKTRLMTVDEFRAFTELPENKDHRFELLQGEVIAVPSPKEVHAWIVYRIGLLLGLFLTTHGIDGTVYGDNLDFILGENIVLKPDVSYTSAARKPKLQDYPTVAPDLVVEVVSPSNTADEMLAKIQIFFQYGAQLVWLVYPKSKTVQIYTLGETPEKPNSITRMAGDLIDGGTVLPGFSAKVSDFFPPASLQGDTP